MRGGGTDHNWELLIDLAHKIEVGACVILTADRGGSAHLVKVGPWRLPRLLVFLWYRFRKLSSRDCRAAQAGRRPNPLPFGKVAVVCGPARTIESLSDLETIEENWRYLQSALEQLSRETRSFLITRLAVTD